MTRWVAGMIDGFPFTTLLLTIYHSPFTNSYLHIRIFTHLQIIYYFTNSYSPLLLLLKGVQ